MLASLKVVVEGCFGIDLSLSYKEDLKHFKVAASRMISAIMQSRRKVVKPTWKEDPHPCLPCGDFP